MRPLFPIAVMLFIACQDTAPGTPPTAPAAPAATPVFIDGSRSDLVFRYLDPASGEVATASALADIPAAARAQVVVYDPKVQLPPGWDLVADLTGGNGNALPRASFAFTTRAASQPAAPTRSAAGAREVIMFSTQGCGYCAKARRFLSDNRIPFTELDVEENPSAPARLSTLGQKAGLSARDLQGVPILFIDGTPVLGWDQRRVASLLGLRG